MLQNYKLEIVIFNTNYINSKEKLLLHKMGHVLCSVFYMGYLIQHLNKMKQLTKKWSVKTSQKVL